MKAFPKKVSVSETEIFFFLNENVFIYKSFAKRKWFWNESKSFAKRKCFWNESKLVFKTKKFFIYELFAKRKCFWN